MSTSTPTTPSARRRLQQRKDARRAILDATQALLVEDGYEQFSMRRLASRCGYTAPTIYHYFGDKQGLLDAVVEERSRLALDRVNRAAGHSDPLRRLRAILDEAVRFGLDNPDHYRLLTLPRADEPPPSQSGEQLRTLLQVPLTELASTGRLRGSVEEAVQLLWIAVHGLVSLRINRPAYPWSDGIAEYVLETALRGLVARPVEESS